MSDIQDTSLVTPDSQDYRYVIPNHPNLLARWSTPADIPKISHLCGTAFKGQFFAYWLTNVMTPNSSNSFMSPYDVALVEDTTTGEVIASACLYAQELEYEGIPYPVGRPEMVATDQRYRKRGLMHVIFKMLHTRSESRGDLAQVIGGIPYFYRQFGYEYAISRGKTSMTEIDKIPKANPGEEELVELREAVTAQDVQDMTEIYESMNRRYSYANWARMPSGFLEMYVARPGTIPTPPEGSAETIAELTSNSDAPIDTRHRRAVLVIDSKTQKTVGFFVIPNSRRGPSINFTLLGFHESVSLPAILSSFIRAVVSYGLKVPLRTVSEPEVSKIGWYFSGYNPFNLLLHTHAHVVVDDSSSTSWMRVQSLPRFLLHVAPVLERRLAKSAFANYTGEFKISFYRSGIKIVLEAGRITNVEDGNSDAWGDSNADFPPPTFLKCLFGYKSLDEMMEFLDDVHCDKEMRPLFEALFPKDKGSCFVSFI